MTMHCMYWGRARMRRRCRSLFVWCVFVLFGIIIIINHHHPDVCRGVWTPAMRPLCRLHGESVFLDHARKVASQHIGVALPNFVSAQLCTATSSSMGKACRLMVTKCHWVPLSRVTTRIWSHLRVHQCKV